MSNKSKKQATLQQMGGKGNLKRSPNKLASSRKSASKKGC